MKNLTFLKLFVTTMFVMATALFAGCVDDNDDTEAPRLEVSPKTLVFDTDGTPEREVNLILKFQQTATGQQLYWTIKPG